MSAKRVIFDILHKPYENKEWFSKNLKDLLSKLLEKDPSKRLGSPEMGGVNSIKCHPFFHKVDWNKALNREMKPPIKPKVK
jgi:hypothetical protein